MTTFTVKNLGLIPYEDAMSIMDDLHAQRKQDAIANTLLVLEHPPVITRGRKLKDVVLPNQNLLEEKGIAVVNADRGGELTYHGPGQIVMYFILNLRECFSGVSDMVRSLENGLIRFFQNYDVNAQTLKGHPGIWVGEKKLASIGLRISEGVTKHGIALNIKNDLEVYRWFHPCGLSGESMTNLETLLHKKISDKEFEDMKLKLCEIFLKSEPKVHLEQF